MPEKKIPDRFQSSKKAIKAAQVAFDTSDEISKKIRLTACQAGISASDQIRVILGLAVTSKPKRARLTVSFSDEDYKMLAESFGMKRIDKLKIKHKVAEKLFEFDSKLK
ncbi:MAG: hypothetical protein COB30_010300 [Ectothiorhodospiraceae bacterium]|nr:hypothetical protein [Ectothiorhodospiraceae bacterium]